MKSRRLIAGLLVAGLVASGPACGKKNEDKLNLEKLVLKSAHQSGVFSYVDATPKSLVGPATTVQVRGVVEDDFRYKARMSVNGSDVLDEVVNDDALAVRFIDPSYIKKFTGSGGDAATMQALAARYWVSDPVGAPSIGDAAVSDRTIGLDPIVDALSVIDYTENAIQASPGVSKFNPENLDYRPAEDPFPQPAPGSGVVRWDLVQPPLPRADAQDTGQGNAALAHAASFRKMAIYVKNGHIVQIREQLAAKFDLLTKFRNYFERYIQKVDAKTAASVKQQLDAVKDNPDALEAALNLGLNQVLVASGEDPVRFHSMAYQFTRPGAKVHADLPIGNDVHEASLAFFGVNSKATAAASVARPGGNTVDTTPTTEATTTTTTGP